MHFKSHISGLLSSGILPLRQYNIQYCLSPPLSYAFLAFFPSFFPTSFFLPCFHSLTGYPINARVAALKPSSTSIQQQQTNFALLVSSTNNYFFLCLFTHNKQTTFTMKLLKLSSFVLALPFATANPVKTGDFKDGQPSDGKLKGGPILGKL